MVLVPLSGRWRFVRWGQPLTCIQSRCCVQQAWQTPFADAATAFQVVAAALQAIQVCKEGAPIKQLWQ